MRILSKNESRRSNNSRNDDQSSDEQMDINERVEAIKEKLRKKIDVCFVKYGLRGLDKIDEAIAAGMRQFIEEEKGIAHAEPQRRPQRTERITERQAINNDFFNDPAVMMAADIDVPLNDDVDSNPISMLHQHIDESVDDVATEVPVKPRQHYDFSKGLPETKKFAEVGEQAGGRVNDIQEISDNTDVVNLQDEGEVMNGFGNFDMSSFE